MEVICSAPGTFLRIPSADFRAEVARNPPLLKVLHGYTQAVLEIRAQSMSCDRFHSVEARAARWLLEMDDRVPQDTFTMTHEFRPDPRSPPPDRVSGCVPVQSAGLDRLSARPGSAHRSVGLEGAACECYEAVRDEFARLVGPPLPRARKALPVARSLSTGA
jgi:CRP-like cAMP-binding protein